MPDDKDPADQTVSHAAPGKTIDLTESVGIVDAFSLRMENPVPDVTGTVDTSQVRYLVASALEELGKLPGQKGDLSCRDQAANKLQRALTLLNRWEESCR